MQKYRVFLFSNYKNKQNILNYANALCLTYKTVHIWRWYLGYLSHLTLHFFFIYFIHYERQRAQSELNPYPGYHLNVAVLIYNNHVLSQVVGDQSKQIHRHFYLQIVHIPILLIISLFSNYSQQLLICKTGFFTEIN